MKTKLLIKQLRRKSLIKKIYLGEIKMIEVLSWCLELLAVVGCLHKFEQKKIKADPALLLLIICDIVLFYGINHLNVSMGLSISFYIAIFIYSLFIIQIRRKYKSHIERLHFSSHFSWNYAAYLLHTCQINCMES